MNGAESYVLECFKVEDFSFPPSHTCCMVEQLSISTDHGAEEKELLDKISRLENLVEKV